MTKNTSYEKVGADRPSEWLVLCDHATNIVPADVAGGDLGLPAEDMDRHIAWDPGARGVSLALAEALNAPYIGSRFSRLVIDPNRGETDPTVLMKLYDGSIIPGNRDADAAEKERRLDAFHRPYHEAITKHLNDAAANGAAPCLVSVHSYTPQLKNRPIRPWQIGLLWDKDDRMLRPLLTRLQAEPDLCVGDNEPYNGALADDCMFQHGTSRGLMHILIEIRNDLIADAETQAQWGVDLARWLTEARAEVDEGTRHGHGHRRTNAA
ncbi:MAG: N-formylglutamate amidohydrolase [Pikeienuella sp.]